MKINKTIKKILSSFFLLFFLIIIIYPITVEARGFFESTKNPLIFKPQISIPGLWTAGEEKVLAKNDTSYIAQMVQGFYNYGIGIAGILATIILMAGGLVWLTSAGSSEKITQAKNLIGGSIIGLVILFGSWMLLRTINPNLVDFKISKIISIRSITLDDGEDGMIDSSGSLPQDTEIKIKCLNAGQLCVDTQPPSMQLDNSICINKFGLEEWGQFSCAYGQKHCCAYSEIINNEINKECKGEKNGTPCKATATDVSNTGICKNDKCEGGNVCCQCGQGCVLGLCASTQCRNDLNPKQCREWCENSVTGWSVFYYVGGSSKYNCNEGLFSQCVAK